MAGGFKLQTMAFSLSLTWRVATSLQLCRFCAHTDLNFHGNLAGLLAFRVRKPVSVKCCSADEPPADPLSLGSDFDAKKFRHEL
ncbi:hypothetical protein Ddye_003827 [Dipteronia dyeriana]|uniref:Secreted protein n=1 Tax=Dipteronia dyeriana TaxID=168575 RepID=A0AAD9XTQ8_9ROSI|nr:hypothetical protein Ddye_003827 [Dipteronia dyeriana]